MEKIEKHAKIMSKPLPQILDELDENMHKTAEFCRRAEEAAEKAQQAASISTRELAVLRMVATGANNREIAEQLSVSEATVKAHLHNIMNKLQVKNRAQVVAFQAALEEKFKSTKGYVVVFEKAKDNYSAYLPDMPGCIATGKTRQDVEKNIKEAITFHLEGLKEDGLPLPEPSSFTEYVEV